MDVYRLRITNSYSNLNPTRKISSSFQLTSVIVFPWEVTKSLSMNSTYNLYKDYYSVQVSYYKQTAYESDM